MAANNSSVVKAASATQAAASTVDSVTFSKEGDYLQVLNFAATRLYFTFVSGTAAGTGSDADAPAPTVGGVDCYCVMPNSSLTVPVSNGVGKVKLISGGPMDYTAQVF